MKKISSVIILLLVCGSIFNKTAAQTDTASYSGAKATKKQYKAAYQLDNEEDAKITGTLHNIANALSDERLAGKLSIELVVHGAGVKVFMKGSPYEEELKTLKQKGVILAMCLNTMKMRNLTKDQLYPFIGYVPSGNGELIILQQQGWAVIHP